MPRFHKQVKGYHPKMAVQAYILAKQGLANAAIAKSLGFDDASFPKEIKKHEELEYAINLARENLDQTFGDYIYGKLSSEGKELWSKLQWMEDDGSTPEKVQELFTRMGEPKAKKMRQQMFLHAMISSGFDYGTSCAKCAISRKMVAVWQREDESFKELLEEISWHQDNFFETGFMDLVKMRNPFAIVHAVKTRLRHRGYGEKLEIEHTHKNQVQFTFSDLIEFLKPETLVELEQAITKKEEALALESKRSQRAETLALDAADRTIEVQARETG